MSTDAEVVTRALSEGTRMTAETLERLRRVPTLELVEALQPSLISTDDKNVCIALYVMGRATQHRVGEHKLNKPALVTLIQFFGVKARRYATLDAAVEAVSVMLQSVHQGDQTVALLADKEVIEALLTEVLSHVHAQSLLLTTRKIFYEIYKVYIMDAALLPAVLECGGAAFLKLFLGAVDGERDPSLLLSVFVMHDRVVSAASADVFSFQLEDYFESIAAYFPVLFTPPAGCNVTRADLKRAIGTALQNPKYHEQCISFLCGKMSSPSSTSKEDAFELVEQMFQWPPKCACDVLASHAAETVAALRAEALKLNAVAERNPDALELLGACLRALSAVARIAAEGSPRDDVLLSSLEPIVGGALATIETDTAAGRTYATLLHACCRSDIRCAVGIGRYLFPLIESLILTPTNSGARVRRLENCVSCLGGMLAALEEHLGRSQPDSGVQKRFCDEATFVKHAVLSSLCATVVAVAREEPSQYLMRVSGECAMTWAVIAKHCGPCWMSSADAVGVYRLVLRNAFSSAADDETSQALLRAIGMASRVDAPNVLRAVGRQDETERTSFLAAFATESRFLPAVRAITSTSSRADVAQLVVQILLEECLGPVVAMANAEWGDPSKHTVDQELFAIVAGLVGMSDALYVQVQGPTWMRLALSLAAPSAFDFASLLFIGFEPALQSELCAAAVKAATVPHHADPHHLEGPAAASTLTLVHKAALCGAPAAVFSDCAPRHSAVKLLTVLFTEIQRCTSKHHTDDESRAAAVEAQRASDICVRTVGAVCNKATVSVEDNANLLHLVADWSRHAKYAVAAAITKGLLARGANDLGGAWLEVLLAGLAEPGVDGSAVAAGLSTILTPPRPTVTTPFWEQRMFQLSIQLLTAEDAGTLLSNRLQALSALVAVAKPSFVQTATDRLLSFVRTSCGPALSLSPAELHTLWASAAPLLEALHAAAASSCETHTADVRGVSGLVLSDDCVFAGLADLLCADGAVVPMASRRAVLHVFTCLARELESLHGADSGGARLSQGASGRVVGGGIQALPLETALGFVEERKKILLRSLQAALQHPKRLVRKDAAACRHAWDRVLKHLR